MIKLQHHYHCGTCDQDCAFELMPTIDNRPHLICTCCNQEYVGLNERDEPVKGFDFDSPSWRVTVMGMRFRLGGQAWKDARNQWIRQVSGLFPCCSL